MKILALDPGDKWVGTALSDALGMFANPYKTSPADELITFLKNLFLQEKIQTIVVGHPKTMRGTESDQTRKVVDLFENLKRLFPDKTWILWDERLSSKHADQLKRAKTKEEKIHTHSVAAAFILSTYLEYLNFQKSMESSD
jgi:putative Holliday junction resolvase